MIQTLDSRTFVDRLVICPQRASWPVPLTYKIGLIIMRATFAFLDSHHHSIRNEHPDHASFLKSSKIQHGSFVSASTTAINSFGHQQLDGVAPVLCETAKRSLGYKYNYAVVSYLQRSARHIASRVDVEQTCAVVIAAVELSVTGRNAVMPVIARESDMPYRQEAVRE